MYQRYRKSSIQVWRRTSKQTNSSSNTWWAIREIKDFGCRAVLDECVQFQPALLHIDGRKMDWLALCLSITWYLLSWRIAEIRVWKKRLENQKKVTWRFSDCHPHKKHCTVCGSQFFKFPFRSHTEEKSSKETDSRVAFDSSRSYGHQQGYLQLPGSDCQFRQFIRYHTYLIL